MKNKLRQLALKLYTYPESEKNWVLDNLDQIQRDKMQKMLQSLQQVSRFDAHIVHELLLPSSNDNVTDVGYSVSDTTDSYVFLVDKLPANKIAAILSQEPGWFSRALFGIYDWRWQDEVIPLLKTDIRITLQRLRDKEPVYLTNKMQSAVLVFVLDAIKKVDDMEHISGIVPLQKHRNVGDDNIFRRMMRKLWQ